MIAIVDTGGANLASILFSLQRLGHHAIVTRDGAAIRAASHVILPGVGAARDAMRRIRAAGLAPLICGLTQPVLGICLGLQLFFERSLEGDTPCLGILPGTVRPLAARPDVGVTVPHMGWNVATPTGPTSRLFSSPAEHFYFVHSYQAPDGPWVRLTTDHGGPVVAALEKDNFFGVQFHPERSAQAGAALLGRFVTL